MGGWLAKTDIDDTIQHSGCKEGIVQSNRKRALPFSIGVVLVPTVVPKETGEFGKRQDCANCHPSRLGFLPNGGREPGTGWDGWMDGGREGGRDGWTDGWMDCSPAGKVIPYSVAFLVFASRESNLPG